MKHKGRYLGIVAAMCGLSAATVGLITNVAGLFFGPMAEEFGIMQGAASLTLTIANVCMAIGGLATRKLSERVPLKVMLLGGLALLAGSTALTAVAPSIAVVYAASVPVNAFILETRDVPNIMKLPWENALALVGVSVGLTLIAGLIPSSAAARRDPVAGW